MSKGKKKVAITKKEEELRNFIIHDLRIVYGTECFYGCLRKEVEE